MPRSQQRRRSTSRGRLSANLIKIRPFSSVLPLTARQSFITQYAQIFFKIGAILIP